MASGIGPGISGLGGVPQTGTTTGAPTANAAFEMQQNPGWLSNQWYGANPTGHNEAVMAWQRERVSAQEAREYEKWLADTQMQRKVADYMEAGFSPLAALENAGGNYTPSTAAASSQAAEGGHSQLGGVLGAIVAAIAMVASKGISAASTAKATAAAEATKHANAVALQ